METQKIVNLLADSTNEESKFVIKKWFVIDNQTANDKYNPNDSVNFDTETINQVFMTIMMPSF